MGKGPTRLSKKRKLGTEERALLFLPAPYESSQEPGAPSKSAQWEARKTEPGTLIPSITLALRGRSVFNQPLLISPASPGRKVTKQRFHFDVIKLALNKYTACSHTRHATPISTSFITVNPK